MLWNNGFGRSTSEIVGQLNRDTIFSDDEISLRNAIGNFFDDHGLNDPLSNQLMLANFVLSPPGLLVINNIDNFFPAWIVDIYNSLYLSNNILSSSVSAKTNTNQGLSENHPKPEAPLFTDFPKTLSELLTDRIHLNRLLGLSNLYYIDPEDREIFHELESVRLSLAAAIDVCPESELQGIWASEFGERYWALVRSGIQKEPLKPHDQSFKDKAVFNLDPTNGGFGSPGSTNSFLIAMLYFMPGSMTVDNAETKIPNWIYPQYHQIFVENPS